MSLGDTQVERLNPIFRLRMLDHVRLRDVRAAFEQTSWRIGVNQREKLDCLVHPLQLQRHLEDDEPAEAAA